MGEASSQNSTPLSSTANPAQSAALTPAPPSAAGASLWPWLRPRVGSFSRPAPDAVTDMGARARLRQEIAIITLITFGVSGVRSTLTLIGVYLSGGPDGSKVVLNPSRAVNPWLDFALQLSGSAVLFGWGFLALFVLGARLPRLVPRDVWWGLGLAAAIGLPGLALLIGGRVLGLSRPIEPSEYAHWLTFVSLVVWALANGFAEEIVVVGWLCTRLEQLKIRPWVVVAASALLRGSYHLYQGLPGGVGNVVMGVVFAVFFVRCRRVWPLVVGHVVIDVVAFVGFPLLAVVAPGVVALLG